VVADGSREDQGADHLGHDRDRLAAMRGLGPSGNEFESSSRNGLGSCEAI
jgi:hypothetical protein